MIEFKVFDKNNQIVELTDSYTELMFAKNQLYSKYNTNEKVLHLFYAGTYAIDELDLELDFREYDRVFVDFSAADFVLRFWDMNNFTRLIKSNNLNVISKNAVEKNIDGINWIYIDPLIFRVSMFDFTISNDVKDNDYFYLGGHARYHRLLFLETMNSLNGLSNIDWSQRTVDETLFMEEIPYEFKEVYQSLNILKILPKCLDILNIQDNTIYHNNANGTEYILNNAGVKPNLEFYTKHYAEIISESIYYHSINPAKKDLEFLNFSEKTFKPLSLGYPFISFCLPNSFAKIKEWGFKLYDELFDYSFDTIIDDNERMSHIISQLNSNEIGEKYKTNIDIIMDKHIYNKRQFVQFKKEMLVKYEKSLLR
jgi:hypothetical protein